MSDGPIVGAASLDDVAYFARRRYPDDEGRRLYAALAETAPSGAYVARDEGTPVGIAVAHALEDEWFLSDLFVEPSFRTSGTGWELLRELTREAGDVTRSGLVDPSETGGLAFFLRRGVALQTPVVTVSGSIPKEEELARMAAGDYRFATAQIDPAAQRTALASLDRDVRGSARPYDHRYFADNATGVAFEINGEFVGYAYVWPSGRIGPMVTSSAAYAVQMFAFALMLLVRTYGASWCRVMIPGTNVRVVRAAMRAGLTIESSQIFASDGPLLDLSRYVGYHPLLF